MNPTPSPIQPFIDRWRNSGAAERANYQLVRTELCDVIGVAHPRPASENPHENAYVFEKAVPSAHGTTNFIDLYKRSCFVLEAKQGADHPRDQQDGGEPVFSEAALQRLKQRKTGTAIRGTKGWDTAMEKAHKQAQTYARSLPAEEIQGGRPPFILVVDVGNSLALYSEFSRTGGNYIPFPDPHNYRLKLDDLHDANVRQLLRQMWDDPLSLDPSRRSAKVTREIAARLAALAKSLEGSTDPETVAQFLMRCLFTMFAEDVGMLPERSFTQLLDDIRRAPESFQPMMEHLWATMNTGGFSVILRRPIPRFNGGLFAHSTALPLSRMQIELLVEAAKSDWRDVEPAIFGTLLEQALDPVERHKLGAHYTPRAYVERLVKPTIIEPLRAEWESVQAAAALYADAQQPDKAIAEVETFHRRLATIRILDPACGSGNFLYVTLEHLKRLEGEVLNTLRDLGEGQMRLEMAGITVSPQQFLGIEVNPRAAAIAELVLWIGYLQWHYRTSGDTPHAEPIIKDYHNIECRDAVLAWDAVEPLLDAHGHPVTRWDGRTTKTHPITGEEVPDETARIPAYKYIHPRPAEWPQADFVVGNPPFIGIARMRDALGDGYTESLRRTYKNVPESVDYVMYWWHIAGELTRQGKLQRFGLITTNSLRQTFSRRVLQNHLDANDPLSLMFAIPDHPWVDSADGAAVRIAMTVGEAGKKTGLLQSVISERQSNRDDADIDFSQKTGMIQPDLTIGAKVSGTVPLQANSNISNRGVQVIGAGFLVTRDKAAELGLGRIPGTEKHIRDYRNGRDLTSRPRGLMAIDLFGLEVNEVQTRFPEIYQWVYERVKPERDQNNRKSYRENWWIHGEPRANFRPALTGLSRYIATVETSKHRFFVFLDNSILPDNKLVNIALDDAYFLGVLSSQAHVVWALAAGSWLGVGNDPVYVKSRCFEAFPFPDATEAQKSRIRALAEQLDAHRKRQQAQHPTLALTDMYNVLEKVRGGDVLSAKERIIHEEGLVSILQQLHDELDAAVFDAYGWPPDLSDEALLQYLVDLNATRAAEEATGLVRWLRPEYQAPHEVQPKQAMLLEEPEEVTVPGEPSREVPVTLETKQDWPKALKDRATAARAVLAAFSRPVGVEEAAGAFNGRVTPKRLEEVGEILDMLVALGQVGVEAGKYLPG